MKACLLTNQMFCIENYSTISMYYQQNEKSTGMFYFAETHTQTTNHKVKVALIVSVDLNNLGKCQHKFC